MDFISNLIKRPISLVLNETSNTMDKYPISGSLPNTPSVLDNKKDLPTARIEKQNQQTILNHKNDNNNKRCSSSMSSSYNDDNMTDFIGVPQEFLDEFKDILPPPPFCLQNSTQSLLDIDIRRSLSITAAPPLLAPTMAMKASQTIDELLSQINDNLQEAGLTDEVLPIASPSNNSELSPLSAETAVNNSKQLASSTVSNTQENALKISTTSDGSSSSTKHKFPTNSELLTIGTCDDHKQQLQDTEQQQHPAQDELNNSGVNKSSNKFLGLMEFDESKIPALPGDLNPNIEEEYKVTFEECLIPTLKAQHTTAVREVLKVDKTHLLLPSETDANSSDNETFADCDDERDPLGVTFGEPASLDVTELESFQSAANKSFNSTFNNTMENIAAIILESEDQPFKYINPTQMMAKPPPVEPLDEDEPMDIDMDATMEIIQNTTNNIENVEKVLQHAENILQDLEAKNVLGIENTEKHSETFEMENSTSSQHQEMQNSEDEKSLNISGELLANKSNPISSKLMETHNEDVVQEENNVSKQLHDDSDKNINLTPDFVSSTCITNSLPSPVTDSTSEIKLNSKTSNLNYLLKLQPTSAPSSPTFPIRGEKFAGFPSSPKSRAEKKTKSSFLEKSDYLSNPEIHVSEEKSLNNIRETCSELSSKSLTSNVNANSLKRRTFTIDNLNANGSDTQQSQIFAENKIDKEICRTFSVKENENGIGFLKQFPSIDKENENISTKITCDMNSRRTFNLPSEEGMPNVTEQTDLNKSFTPMEVDGYTPQKTTMPLATYEEQSSQSHLLPFIEQKPESSLHPAMPKDSESPLSVIEISSDSSSPQWQSPPIPTLRAKKQSRSQSPLLPAMQAKSKSSPTPRMQSSSHSPPLTAVQTVSLDTMQNKSKTESTPPEDFTQKVAISSPPFELYASQPLPTLIQKRPSIRDARGLATDILSAKEQSNIKAKDEKDVFVEKQTPSPVKDIFSVLTTTSSTLTNSSGFTEFDQTSSSNSSIINNNEQQAKQIEDEFSGNGILILNPSDFDYLLTKGNNNIPVHRSSLLLKFDPLVGVPVPDNQGQQQLQIPTNANNAYLNPTIEEEEHSDSNCSFVLDNKKESCAKLLSERSQEVKQHSQLEQQVQQHKRQLPTQGAKKKNATMSVDVIKDISLDNDCNKTFENSNSTQSDDKQINYKMDELEKKIKNEVLKTEDIGKKLKDAEQREEALIKRITEKDKTIAKMTGVIEAYEKAIAELIADKEQITQHYEKQLAEIKADRDSNYHHLTSLETTFSDLHVKYEKSKEMTCQLKENEEALQAEKRKNLEILHSQEQRYDKMKNHAMQQLEIANKKLESQTREHSIEVTKLKALLKKEEIARSSINEQLAHKTIENAELVKICDELISGQGSNFSFEPYDPKKH